MCFYPARAFTGGGITYGTERVAFALRWVQGLERRRNRRRRRNSRRDRRTKRRHILVDRAAELLGQQICGFESGISDLVAGNDAGRIVLQVLLTLLIRGTADGFLTGCRHAAKCSPAYTVDIAGITAGRCSGFIGAGLLFEDHQRSHRGRRKGTKRK